MTDRSGVTVEPRAPLRRLPGEGHEDPDGAVREWTWFTARGEPVGAVSRIGDAWEGSAMYPDAPLSRRARVTATLDEAVAFVDAQLAAWTWDEEAPWLTELG